MPKACEEAINVLLGVLARIVLGANFPRSRRRHRMRAIVGILVVAFARSGTPAFHLAAR